MQAPYEQSNILKEYIEDNPLLEGHTDWVQCVAVLPNGDVISGSRDGTLKVWNVNTGECVNTFEGHTNSVVCVAVLADGKVISGSGDGTLKVWDVKTGKCVDTFVGHNDAIVCVAVLPNGDVISGSKDGTLRVWGSATGECTKVLEGHSALVGCVAVLTNGNVVSGSFDRTLKVWIDNWQSEYQIKKAARILAQGYQDKSSLFSLSPLPVEIYCKIAGYTGDSTVLDEEEATDTARRYFDVKKPLYRGK